MPTVRIPSLLQPMTGGQSSVQASGTTLSAVIDDLERQFPGMRDRVIERQGFRPDVMIFIGADEAPNLDTPVPPDGEVHILPAIAGG